MDILKDNYKLYLLYIIIIIGITLFFAMGLYLIIVLGDDIQNIKYAKEMQTHIKKNNLSYPFYNVQDLNKFNKLNYANQNNFYFNRTPESFQKLLMENYYYEKNSYNCVYYSYVWASYFVYNKKDLNLNFKFVTTDNHIFTMAFNDSGYCIADELKLDCNFIN